MSDTATLGTGVIARLGDLWGDAEQRVTGSPQKQPYESLSAAIGVVVALGTSLVDGALRVLPRTYRTRSGRRPPSPR